MMHWRIRVSSGVFLVFVLGMIILFVNVFTIFMLEEDIIASKDRISIAQEENSRLRAIIGDAFDFDFSDEAVFSLVVTATAYTARSQECDEEPWVTSSGSPSRVGAIAVSRNLEALGIGLGDLVIIKGMGLFRVEDRMNARWRNRIDILHGNLEAAKLFGVTEVEIMWIGGDK